MSQSPTQSTDHYTDPVTDQSSESLGASYERTDGLTKNQLQADINLSHRYAQARIPDDHALDDELAALRARPDSGAREITTARDQLLAAIRLATPSAATPPDVPCEGPTRSEARQVRE